MWVQFFFCRLCCCLLSTATFFLRSSFWHFIHCANYTPQPKIWYSSIATKQQSIFRAVLINALLFIFDVSVFFFLALRNTHLCCMEFVCYFFVFQLLAARFARSKAIDVAWKRANKANLYNATHRFTWSQDKIKIDAAITLPYVVCSYERVVYACLSVQYIKYLGVKNTASFWWPWNQRHLLTRFIYFFCFSRWHNSFCTIQNFCISTSASLIFRLSEHRTIQIVSHSELDGLNHWSFNCASVFMCIWERSFNVCYDYHIKSLDKHFNNIQTRPK